MTKRDPRVSLGAMFTLGRCLLLAFILCLPRFASAQADVCGVAEVSGSIEAPLDLGQHACVYADADRQLTLEQMLSDEGDALFQPVQGGLIDFGYGSARYWVRVDLRNADATGGTWWITHDIPVADMLRVHLLAEGQTEPRTLLTLSSSDAFGLRSIPYRHLVSAVPLGANETARIYIEYVTDQATEMPLFIETVPGFFARTQDITVQIMALTALILGMGLISTAYLYGLAGKQAFIYGAYVLSSGVLLFHMEGYAFQYLWPWAPGFNQFALAIFALISISLGLLFVSNFTRTAQHNPTLNRVAMGTIVLFVLLGVMMPIYVSTLWYKTAFLIAVIVATLMQVTLAVVAFRRGTSGSLMLLIGFGLLAGSFIFSAIGYLTEGLFQQELAGVAMRAGFLAEALAFSTAIALRIQSAVRERDASLREQLQLSQDRLHLSEALRKAETDRQRAAEIAEQSRQALASAAHDIRQPLASIQMALEGGEAARGRIEGSLAYLDGILRSSLEESLQPLGSGQEDPPQKGASEVFSADIVLQNLRAMFQTDAVAQGTDLRIVSSSTQIVADPLSLMRIVGNLVSNALRHAQASKVVVGCRRVPEGLQFEVHDNGIGMSREMLVAALEPGTKGDASEGHGLGLAIANELAESHDLIFAMSSKPGQGTVARVTVPHGSHFINQPQKVAQAS